MGKISINDLPERPDLVAALESAGIATPPASGQAVWEVTTTFEQIDASRAAIKEASKRIGTALKNALDESTAKIVSIAASEILTNILEYEIWQIDPLEKERLLSHGEFEKFAKQREQQSASYILLGYGKVGTSVCFCARSKPYDEKKPNPLKELSGFGSKIIENAFNSTSRSGSWKVWAKLRA